jgi:hypothetical protein
MDQIPNPMIAAMNALNTMFADATTADRDHLMVAYSAIERRFGRSVSLEALLREHLISLARAEAHQALKLS